MEQTNGRNQKTTTICHHFQRTGNCKFGARCRFSHDRTPNDADSVDLKRIGIETKQITHSGKDGFISWRYAIPLHLVHAKPLGMRLSAFFMTALDLVDTSYDTAQQVVMSLTSEGGFLRIKELLDQDFKSMSNVMRYQAVSVQMVPFLKTINHPNVTASIMLENKIDTIYNFLYGRQGERGLEVFTLIVDVLTEDHRADLRCLTNLGPILAAFSSMIDINGHAPTNEHLPALADLLFNVCNNIDAVTTRHLHKFITKIGRRLGVGQSFPHKEAQVGLPQKQATFHLSMDLPGSLSLNGPRHDNDFAQIANIQVLPTFGEIKASRPPYLPGRDSSQLHLAGIDGLLDRHFRLVREDTVGQLRDAISAEMDRGAALGNHAARTCTYDNLVVIDLHFSRWKGLQLLVRIDQPRQIRQSPIRVRKDWWEGGNRLRPEALVCIIGQQDSVTFCTVSQLSHTLHEESTKTGHEMPQSLNMHNDPDHCYLQLQLIDCVPDTVSNILDRVKLISENQRLVEFPGVLLPSFRPTLEALKKMSQHNNLPFADILAPRDNLNDTKEHLKPPLYAMRPGFQFNLSPIMNDQSLCHFVTGQPFDVDDFKRRSQLDDAQAEALVNCLQQSFSLIQGPPGTGKSFTGVALIKVLLAIAKNARLGPILCVCYTNHALDQLLEHLVQHDVGQIIRIGSRSKSEMLENCNLRHVTKNVPMTGVEKKLRWNSVQQLMAEEQQITEILQTLSKPFSEQVIEAYLEANQPEHWHQLFYEFDEDGFQTVHHRERDEINRWLRGAQSNGSRTPERPLETLKRLDLHQLSRHERLKLHVHWIEEIQLDLQNRLNISLESHKNAKAQLDGIRNEQELRCLEEANIIGVTTTGLARQLDLLHKLRSKVLVCEEAGEVLEAHILTAMLPSLEHVILIGDHLQLPPRIQNYDLSRESRNGQQFSLDLSLFERLVAEENSKQTLPFSILETQRRMHPSISELIRSTLYPKLIDSPHVMNYPAVAGMKRRLFWLDHTRPEATSDRDRIVSTSHSNDFEVSMIAALVTHLVRQGVYASHEIAVLTPYLGQLHKIRKALRNQFEITLNERDIQEMERQGIVDDDDNINAVRAPVAKAALLKVLAVSTIDNFQGEEAQVVLISLVRSNAENKCGFLRTPNRINVLLSRAKHGMYIMGNAQTSAHVPMWSKVIGMLQRSENFGSQLQLECPRHKEVPILVSKPDDFVIFSPEGGCDKKCDRRLECGHRCQSKCHSETLHKAVKCLEPCPRQLKNCDHGCPRLCGEVCVDRCQVGLIGLQVVLQCGHLKTALPCWQKQNPATVVCRTLVQRTIPGCNHTVEMECHVDPFSDVFRCPSVCGATLGCGHVCQKRCHNCNTRQSGGLVSRSHGDCRQVCGRKLNSCSHHCNQTCHGDLPCECTAPCENFCEHSKCGKRCSEPCAPCASITCATSRCTHGSVACTMPCSAPCDWLPCSKRCDNILTCGHQCPTVCGEICPTPQYCQLCADTGVKETVVDFIMMSTFGEVDLDEDPCVIPACGHILTISSMDGQMELQQHYEMHDNVAFSVKNESKPLSMDELKVCGTCRGSLRNIARYGRIVRRALLDESTKKFIRWAGLRTIALTERLHAQKQRLNDSVEDARDAESVNDRTIKIEGAPLKQMQSIFAMDKKRYRPMANLRREIIEHLERVRVEEQPYKRVLDLVQHAKRCSERTVGHMQHDTTVLQTRETIQMTALSLRCDLTVLSDFLSIMQGADLKLDLQLSRDDCEKLVQDALEANQPGHAAESHVLFAQLCAAERSHTNATNIDELVNSARKHIKEARALCDKYRGSTQRIVNELDEVEKMLRNSTFYMPMRDEEWGAVMAAMSREFRGTGHWYLCANGHPFTVGECGMPMEQARCPQCDAPIGGQNHEAEAGVSRAEDLERRFGQMQL